MAKKSASAAPAATNVVAGGEAQNQPADVAQESKQAQAEGEGLVVDEGKPTEKQGDGDVAQAEESEFPKRIRVLNHSSAHLACRVSGVAIQPGGSAEFALHDEEHEEAVLQSFENLVANNYIPRDQLVFQRA